MKIDKADETKIRKLHEQWGKAMNEAGLSHPHLVVGAAAHWLGIIILACVKTEPGAHEELNEWTESIHEFINVNWPDAVERHKVVDGILKKMREQVQ